MLYHSIFVAEFWRRLFFVVFRQKGRECFTQLKTTCSMQLRSLLSLLDSLKIQEVFVFFCFFSPDGRTSIAMIWFRLKEVLASQYIFNRTNLVQSLSQINAHRGVTELLKLSHYHVLNMNHQLFRDLTLL